MKSIFFALAAGVSFSLGNFILGHNSGLGVLAREVAEQGTLVYTLIFALMGYARCLYTGTKFWTWEESNFRNPETNGFYWQNLFGLILYSAINISSGFAVVFCFQFAIYGDINQGILTSLFGLSSIFSAVLAYFIFGEKLKLTHVS